MRYTRIKILEQRRQLNRELEKKRKNMFNKYFSLMTQRKRVSKEEILNELFPEDINIDNNHNSLSLRENSCFHFNGIKKNNNDENVENKVDNNNKEDILDNLFVTNLKNI